MAQYSPRLAGLLGLVLAVGAAPRPAQAASDLTSLADQVLVRVNQQRAARGLSPLVRVGALDRAAQAYAIRMAAEDFFDHNAPDGSTPGQRLQDAGYTGRTWGENIAGGQETADAVMTSWMNSPGHAANILNANYDHIGIGVALGGPYHIYWVQDFGATGGAPPASPAPRLESLNPTSGAVGTAVTLAGTNLGSPGGVTFGGVPAVVEQWSAGQVIARVPSGGTTGAVVLTNAEGTSNSLVFGGAVVTPPNTDPVAPVLRGLSPRFGLGGSTVRLAGTGFGATPGQITVQGAAATVLSWTDTLIVVRINGTARGWHSFRVQTVGGQTSNPRDFRQTR